MAFVDDQLLAALAILIHRDDEVDGREERRQRNRRRNPRRFWVRPWILRREEGLGTLTMVDEELRNEDPASFQNFMRLREEVFDDLLSQVTPMIAKKDTNMRKSISARHRLEVTLRFLASGNSYKDLQYLTRIPHNTLSKIIPEVLLAIKTCLENNIKTPSTPEEWQQVAARFLSVWNFPNCIGALDGKHIQFCAPVNERAFYRCYKGYSSIILLAVVDADCKFIFTNIGVNGRMNDAGVFHESGLHQALQDGTLNLPPPIVLPQGNKPVPYVFVGDDIFPLMKNLLKPYGIRGNDISRRVFDYRLSRARRIVENAFGILANRFRVLLRPINLSPGKVELITSVCCLLHNYILNKRPVMIDAGVDGDGQPEACPLQQITQRQERGNRHSNDAIRIRDEFRSYFNGPGRVPWQERAVAGLN